MNRRRFLSLTIGTAISVACPVGLSTLAVSQLDVMALAKLKVQRAQEDCRRKMRFLIFGSTNNTAKEIRGLRRIEMEYSMTT